MQATSYPSSRFQSKLWADAHIPLPNRAMSFNNKNVIDTVAKRPGIPDRQNAINILTAVMQSISAYCVDTILKGVGVILPGLGYAFFENSFDKRLQRPQRELQFVFDDNFVQPLNLKTTLAQQMSTYQVGNMPLTDKHGPIYRLNFIKIGNACGYDHQDCIEGYQLFVEEIKRFIRQGRDGTIDLHIGKFTVKGFNLTWTYDPVFIKTVKAQGTDKVVKTSQALTTKGTFRPCDNFPAETIVYK